MSRPTKAGMSRRADEPGTSSLEHYSVAAECHVRKWKREVARHHGSQTNLLLSLCPRSLEQGDWREDIHRDAQPSAQRVTDAQQMEGCEERGQLAKDARAGFSQDVSVLKPTDTTLPPSQAPRDNPKPSASLRPFLVGTQDPESEHWRECTPFFPLALAFSAQYSVTLN